MLAKDHNNPATNPPIWAQLSVFDMKLKEIPIKEAIITNRTYKNCHREFLQFSNSNTIIPAKSAKKQADEPAEIVHGSKTAEAKLPEIPPNK